MSRWPADACARLEQAAMELFAAQGFAQTTVPQITARAGLTTRTFFRHFADKREVLFAAEAELPDAVHAAMVDAPPTDDPMTLVRHGLERAAASRLQALFDPLRARRAVIRTDSSLRERELSKLAVLAGAITSGLTARRVEPHTAVLVAGTAVTVFTVALDRWLDQDHPDPPLVDMIRATLDTHHRALVAPPPEPDGGGR